MPFAVYIKVNKAIQKTWIEFLHQCFFVSLSVYIDEKMFKMSAI